jgi:hypothetical protein
MSAAIFTPGSGSFFTPHSERLDALPPSLRVAASETWHAVLKLLPRGQTRTHRRITDRVLADKMGRSRRFVQKGLRVLQDLGMIERVRRFGGRIIAVLERIRGRDKPNARPKPTADQQPKASRDATIPNVGIIPPLSPEQAAAAQARVLAAQQAELPEPTPEELAQLDRFLDESRRRRQAAAQAKFRPRLVNLPRPAAPDAPGSSAQAILEAKRRALGITVASAPQPAPEPRPEPARPPRPDDGT